jgi:hypothetical protein
MLFKLPQLITLRFSWKNGLLFFLGFVLFTIIGTLSHEAGHYAIAKKYLKNPTLHYGYVSHGDEWKDDYKITESEPYSEETLTELNKRYLLLTLGGPLQTILTGSMGLFILLLRRKKVFDWKNWVAVFLAYFWAREVYMFLFLGFDWMVKGSIPNAGDEVRIANYLNLPPFSIAAILGAIGIILLIYVTFKIIPLKDRLTFIISGLMGSIVGFIFWLGFAGPLLMP